MAIFGLVGLQETVRAVCSKITLPCVEQWVLLVVFVVKEGASRSSLGNSFVVDTLTDRGVVFPLKIVAFAAGVTISGQVILPQTVVTTTAITDSQVTKG